MSGARMVTLRLDDLTLDAGTQSREQLDPTTAREYAEAMQAGDEFPSICCVSDGQHYWPWDGFHRIEACRLAELETVEASVTEGTLDDAIWLSLSANRKHPLKRTNEDKRKAVKRALQMRPEMSDRAIAEHCGVGHPMVAEARKALEEYSSRPAPSHRVGRDGRTTNTANIGKPKPAAPPAVAVVEDGTPEAEAIDAAVPLLDEIGLVVPEAMREAFAMRGLLEELAGQLRQAQRRVGELAFLPGGEALRGRCELRESDGRQSYRLDRLHAAAHEVLACRPHASVCPHCYSKPTKRTGDNCACCRGAGWVTKEAWDRSPEDYRAAAVAARKGGEL